MAPPDDADDGAGTVSVTIRLSSQPDRQLDRIQLARPSTVGDLKLHLAQTLEGKPKPEGIVCVLGGRVLRDGEVLGELAGRVGGSGENGGDDDVGDDSDISGALDLTLIIRPSAWTETPPSLPVKESAPPALAPPIPSTRAVEPVISAAPTQSPITRTPADLEHDVLPAEMQPEASTSAGASEATAASSSGYTPAYVAAGAAPPAVAIPSATVSATNAQEPVTAPITPPSGGAPPVAANPYATYLAYLHRLVPIQRALLLLNLQKAHVWYATRSNGFDRVSSTTTTTTTAAGERLEEVEAMLKEVGVWQLVEQSEIEAKKRWEEASRRRDGERRLAREFEVVRISGLPYLLHTPAALLARQADGDSAQDAEAHVAVHRNRAIYHVLTTMLQLVLTLQPSAPAIAYGRGSGALGRTGGGGGITGMRAAALDDRRVALGPGAATAPARRRATLSVIINLDAVLSLFVPLFLLSLKLAFLLWIFGRRASTSKRIALAIVAAVWVAYEGWAIQRRRAQATRERERAERERRRAARAAAAQAQRNELPRQAGGGDDLGAGVALPERAQPAQQPAAQAPGPAAPNPGRRRTGRNHQHRVPASRLSPKYWLNLIAAVGLVSEARELGLSPRYIAGRPISPAAPPPRTAADRRREAIKRGLRNVAVAVVLFVGTLSPEVERKRKKAIEKRERLLAEKRVAAARQEALRIAAGRAAAPTSAASSSAAPVASTSAVEAPPLRQRRTTITPSDSPFLSSSQGRQRISDAELFRDGPSEAYTGAAGESADPARSGDAVLPSGSAPSDSAASLDDGTTTTAASGNAAEEQSTPVVASEDDDFAATSSASASSSAGDSFGEEDADGDEGGIARRVRARRARLLAQQQQQQGQGREGLPAADGLAPAQDGQDAVEQVVVLF